MIADGKHVAFRASKEDASQYFNYKGFSSIVLMALVDANYNFLYVDVGCNGRANDNNVFERSTLYTAINSNFLDLPDDECLPGTNLKVPYIFVADAAFTLTTRMLKPYGGRGEDCEKVFNYRLSRARRVVENAFGILANRFRVLQNEINLNVTKVQDIVLATCALHNFLKRMEKSAISVDTENTNTVSISPGIWRQHVSLTKLRATTSNRAANQAMKVRNSYCKFFNTIGFVPWQWEAIKKFNF